MLPPRKSWPDHSVLAIDAKSFYASVEAADRNLKPMEVKLAVVGDVNRPDSVVLAASPELKKQYNIRTGSRRFQIPNRHDILVFQARMGRYVDVSMGILDILYRYAPPEAIHIYSIDEAFITLDGTEHLHGSHREVAQQIKRAVYKQFKIPLSVGWGQNKLIAKLTMDLIGKKIGYAECTYEQIPDLLWPHAVRDIWGIGEGIARRLNALGVYTFGQLAAKPLHILRQEFGQAIGEQLYYHAQGLDYSPVFLDPLLEARKGFSNGITLMSDYSWQDTKVVIYEFTDLLSARLRAVNMAASKIQLSMRYNRNASLRGFSKSHTLSAATNLSKHLYDACLYLHPDNYSLAPIRHLSIGVSNLVPESEIQLDLFTKEADEKLRRLSAAIDDITSRFGKTAIYRANSITNAGTVGLRSNKIGGHYE